MSKKLISLVLSVSALFGAVFSSHAAEISVSAQSACLISCDTGEIVYEKNAGERLPMASTTKIMTCLVAIENGELSSPVNVDDRAIGTEGTSLYLEKGDCLTLEDLLYAMMLRSANDAAAAVAYHIAGSIEAFADMMNEKAASLGLSDTHFTNPHGLAEEGHYTSAHDFAVLTMNALKNETFQKIVSSKSHTVKLIGGDDRYVVNHNRLLNSYSGATGVKTGFTKASGRCLVSSATRDGLSFVAVTLNAPNDWEDHKKMLDFGFSEYCRMTAVKKGQLRHSLGVAGCGNVDIVNRDEIELVVRKDSQITYTICSKPIEFAPVSTDIPKGYAKVFVDSKLAAEIPLYPVTNIEEQKNEKSKILSFFK